MFSSFYLFPIISAFFLTAFFAWCVKKIFPHVGLLDHPERYKLKRKPIPYPGGLAIFLGITLSLIFFLPLDRHLIGVLLAATLITTVSFIDDLHPISPWLRLGFQFLAALILINAGIKIFTITNPFGGVINLDLPFHFAILGNIFTLGNLANLFLIFWILMLMNTINWLDGVSGLVSGISAIAALIIFFLAIRQNFHFFDQTQTATLAAIVFGSTSAFWFFDFHPPKILIGDTGTMLLGFLLATLAVLSGAKIATAFLVLGLPILDAGWVILRRIINKQSPLHGDMGHLHHRLIAAGASEKKAILIIYFFAATFGLSALFLNSFGKFIAIIILFLAMIALEIFTHFKSKNI